MFVTDCWMFKCLDQVRFSRTMQDGDNDHVVPGYVSTSPAYDDQPQAYSPSRPLTNPDSSHPERMSGWNYSPTDSCAQCNSLECQLSSLRQEHANEIRRLRSECDEARVRENEIRHRCATVRRDKRELQTSLDEALASLEMYRARVNVSTVCHACKETDVDGCFVPCGHLVSCQDCAVKTQRCSECDRTADFIKDHILLKMR